jgi:hypothetical protein
VQLRTLDALRRERGYFGFQIVAHKIKFVAAVVLRGMNGYFRGRQREDQPAAPCIHIRQSEDVEEEARSAAASLLYTITWAPKIMRIDAARDRSLRSNVG